MSRTAVNVLMVVCSSVFGLSAFIGLILVPAWSSYARLWQRLAATVLSLYVLFVLMAIGVSGALLFVYLWG
ncbi:MAG TPA: hypothetical protein VID48_11760 [Solirubrobacteraceae bacterium]|jgi:hypothetical protein